MQLVLQKIDRRSKPIRKEERVVSNNLKKKRIFLEEDNFDIMSILKQAAKIQSLDHKKLQVQENDAKKNLVDSSAG